MSSTFTTRTTIKTSVSALSRSRKASRWTSKLTWIAGVLNCRKLRSSWRFMRCHISKDRWSIPVFSHCTRWSGWTRLKQSLRHLSTNALLNWVCLTCPSRPRTCSWYLASNLKVDQPKNLASSNLPKTIKLSSTKDSPRCKRQWSVCNVRNYRRSKRFSIHKVNGHISRQTLSESAKSLLMCLRRTMSPSISSKITMQRQQMDRIAPNARCVSFTKSKIRSWSMIAFFRRIEVSLTAVSSSSPCSRIVAQHSR